MTKQFSFAVSINRDSIPNLEFIGGRLSGIFGAYLSNDGTSLVERPNLPFSNANIRAKLLLGGTSGYAERSPRQPKAYEEQDRADGSQAQLRLCRPDTVFCGICAPRRGPGGLALGLKIAGLVILGALFAAPGTLGLCWIFDNPNWNRKIYGAALACVFFPLTLTFYGWAFTGSPGFAWGLC